MAYELTTLAQLNAVEDAMNTPRSYLGQAATRCFFPDTNGGASFPYVMSRSMHFARDKLVNPTAVFPNWRLNGTTEATGGAGTIKAALEYPAGVYTLANECIAASNGPVAHPVGNTALTFNVTVPKGAKFWMRALQNIPGGGWWYGTAGIQTEDFCDISSSNIDKVTSGTVGPSNGISYGPCVIATQTRQPSVIAFGTSRELDSVSGANVDLTNDLGIVGRAVGKVYGYTSAARSGTTIAAWNSGTHTYMNQLVAAGYWTAATNEYAVNDVPTLTGAQIAAHRATFANNLKAQKSDLIVIGQTIYPYTGSSDGFISLANQTVGTNGQRVRDLNQLVRLGIAGEDFYWDISDAVDPFRTNKFPVSRNPGEAARTPAIFTASLSGTTLTVTAVTSGTISVGDPVQATGVAESTWITAGPSAGGVGAYTVNRPHSGFPYPNPVASTSMSTAGMMTPDGLHHTFALMEVIQRSGKINLDYLRR